MIYIGNSKKHMEKEIIKDYVDEYLSNSEICKKYGLNRITVQRILKRNGINLRKKTPGFKVDHHFFSKYTENSCYWAGFILADGNIRNDKRFTLQIKLAKKDREHLLKFKECLSYEGEVKEGSHFYQITVSSEKIINDLYENFNIFPRKSLNCKISNKIPKDKMSHFIRGYLDGDGTITKTSCETLGFIGTFETLNSIREFIFNSGIALRSKELPEVSKTKNIHNIHYYGNSAIKVLDVLYEDSNDRIRLDRKYKIYKKWKTQ